MSIPIHGGRWSAEDQAGITRRSMNDSPTAYAGNIVASMCSFKCECVYITTLIVNELIGDNGVEESIVH